MAEVKWIKITTDIFDNRKIKQIESMPEGDAIIVIWMKLLILAGNVNDSGYLYLTDEIPYTDQLLATQFGRPLATIQLALGTFRRLKMIDIIDDVICVSNWEKYQNIEGMDKIREQNRIRKQKQRDRERALLSDNHGMSRDSHVTVTQSHATDIDKEIDKEKEKDNNPPLSPLKQSSMTDSLKEKAEEWLQYKKERRETYKPTGLKSLVTQIEKAEKAHGASAVIDAIDMAMASGWKGIGLDRIRGDPKPEDVQPTTLTDEERRIYAV